MITPVAVKDLPAGRGQQADIDPVFLGQQAELIGLIHLQIAHPGGQPAGKGQLQPAQEQRPPGHLAVRASRSLGLRFISGSQSFSFGRGQFAHPQNRLAEPGLISG